MDKRLLAFLEKQYRKYAILSPITVIGEVIIEVYLPFLMAKIVDVGIPNMDMAYIRRMGILMIVLAVIALLLGVLSGVFAAIASTGLSKGIRKALFSKIQDFSFANIDKFSTASLITRTTTDVNNIQLSFMMIIRILMRAPVMLICSAVMAYRINPSLSRVFLIIIPLLAIAMGLIGYATFRKFKEMLTHYDSMNKSVQENLIGIRVVKSFVRKAYENNKFLLALTNVRTTQMQAEGRSFFIFPVLMFFTYASVISIAWFGGRQIMVGTMHAGQFFSFISYSSQILMSMMMIAMIFVSIILSRASAVRVMEVLDEEIDIKDNPDSTVQLEDGSIEFKDVDFSYAKSMDSLVLTNINLSIKSGETVGIIGGTGSAKSTLVQVIPRLYDITEGCVKVGGIDVRSYDVETLRNRVAMVLQKNELFSGTIKENLRWGNENATDEEIIEACRLAQADAFINEMPDKYDTFIEQGGTNVSGGQKQRLCIARALLKKPKILILDDSTSAVDTATDARIRQGFKAYIPEVTKLIIAQRIASVEDADKIIVMDEGEITACGTHEELLKSSEIYKEVYYSQQKGGNENA